MLKVISQTKRSLEACKVGALSNNTQANINSQNSSKLEKETKIGDNFELTQGNIKGCLKRYRTFCINNNFKKVHTSHTIQKQNNKYFSSMIDYQKVDLERKLSQRDLDFFTNLLGKYGVNTDEDECKHASTDWFLAFIGNAGAILTPKNTQQVVEILKYCNENNIYIVPQGGNTGLVGANIPIGTEVILSLRKMDSILEFNEVSGVLSIESGCLLENLINFVESKDFEMPYDLPSRGSCTIGGNIATNAGGINYVKHGPLRANVLGLEVVTADGTVLDMMGSVQKDSTGPDLKQLFIQSEGILGVITKCIIQCKPATKEKVQAMIEVQDYNKVLDVLMNSKHFLGRNLIGIEYMDNPSYTLVEHHKKHQLSFPFKVEDDLKTNEYKKKCYMLVEVAGSNKDDLMNMMGELSEIQVEKELIEDMVIADNVSKNRNIWDIRDSMGEALGKHGINISLDVSLDIAEFQTLVDLVRVEFRDHVRIVTGFGHIGDGNLHLNIVVPDLEVRKRIEGEIDDFVMAYVLKFKGSVSAEHGVGTMKAKYLEAQKGSDVIEYMQQVKKILDKNNILNPQKIFTS